jgi:hypothetical protein
MNSSERMFRRHRLAGAGAKRSASLEDASIATSLRAGVERLALVVLQQQRAGRVADEAG